MRASTLGWCAVALVAVAYLADESTTTHTASAASDPADIPANYRQLYEQHGGRCPNMDWALLAAIGWQETHHGTLDMPGVTSGENGAGAGGPMQFLSSTWQEVRASNPDIGSSRYDPANAIPAAAAYLCRYGVADGDIRGAVFQYNHSYRYVADVMQQARAYRQGGAS